MTPLSSPSSIIISDAESGAVIPAFNALIDIISTKMEFAVKFKVLASSSTSKKEFVNNAMKDIQ